MSLVHEQVFVTCVSLASWQSTGNENFLDGMAGMPASNTYVKAFAVHKTWPKFQLTKIKQLAPDIYLQPTFSQLERCPGRAMLAMLRSVH